MNNYVYFKDKEDTCALHLKSVNQRILYWKNSKKFTLFVTNDAAINLHISLFLQRSYRTEIERSQITKKYWHSS